MGKTNLTVKEVLDKIPTLIITLEDCSYIFKTEEMSAQFRRLYSFYKNGEYTIDMIQEFLEENSDNIYVDNLVFILYKNNAIHLNGVEKNIKALETLQPHNSQTFIEKGEKIW